MLTTGRIEVSFASSPAPALRTPEVEKRISAALKAASANRVDVESILGLTVQEISLLLLTERAALLRAIDRAPRAGLFDRIFGDREPRMKVFAIQVMNTTPTPQARTLVDAIDSRLIKKLGVDEFMLRALHDLGRRAGIPELAPASGAARIDAASTARLEGTLKWFHVGKRFGMIEAGGREYFVARAEDIEVRLPATLELRAVTFVPEERHGRLYARQVRPAVG